MDPFDYNFDGLFESPVSPFQLETMNYWDNTTMLTIPSMTEKDFFNDIFADDIFIDSKPKSKFQPASTVSLDKITIRNESAADTVIIQIINPPDHSPDNAADQSLEILPTPQIIPQNQSIIVPNFFTSENSNNQDILYPCHMTSFEYSPLSYQKRCHSQQNDTIKRLKPSTPRHKIKSKKLTKSFSATSYMSSKNRRQRQTQKARYLHSYNLFLQEIIMRSYNYEEKMLYINNHNFVGEDMDMLIIYLSSCSSNLIRKLKIHNSNITFENCLGLVQALKDNIYIEIIDFSHNNLQHSRIDTKLLPINTKLLLF